MIRISSLILILIANKVYCQESTGPPPKFPANFRCNNGKYMDNRWFCDNDMKDCGDLSDESYGCNKDVCGSGKFKCFSEGPCIEITGRCNTITECPDGSDELGCGDETDISNCAHHEGKYLCHDNLKCLDFKYTCDGICNCFDCSDETDHCKKFDSQSCSACPLYCLPTPSGPQCICNSSDYETNKLCKEIENCTGDSSCSQYCTRYNNQTRCLCYEEHHEIRDSNGTKCRSNVWLENVLLYSTTSKIKMLNINSSQLEVIQNDVDCSVLTAAKNYLYFVTRLNNKERLMKTLISSRKTDRIIELDLKIKSLAVDWISSNLYFTANKSLVVCSNDGRICTRLKCCIVNYVALASKFGRMFYTQDIIGEYEHMIMTSNMDGSEETVLLDMSIDNSSSLAVDEWHEKVYWFQSRNKKLHSASFDGLNQKEYLLSGSMYSSHFTSLERYSYFLGVHENKIHLAENSHFEDFVWRTDRDTDNIRELFAYNPHLQLTYDIENPCVSSPCRGLCLLRSAPLANGLNYTCICEHFTSGKNNPWCENDTTRSEDLQLNSSKKIEIKMDSSTKPSSQSTKNEPDTLTKASATFAGPSWLPKTSSNEHYFTIGIIHVVSLMTFVFSALTLFFIIRNNYSAKYRVKDLTEQIEL